MMAALMFARSSAASTRPGKFVPVLAAFLLAVTTGCGGGNTVAPDQPSTSVEPSTPVEPAEPVESAEPNGAEVIEGDARVVDGDTLDIGDERVRLAGMDAPERYQQCLDSQGRPSACGRAATDFVEAMVAGGVSCTVSERDRYGRAVATCASGGIDVGGALVLAGLALNEPRYTPDYQSEEDEARSQRRGIHAGRFVTPWDWRRGERVPVLIGLDQGTEVEEAPVVTTRGTFTVRHGVRNDDTRKVVSADAAEIGAWGRTSSHLVGHSPAVAFGVALHEGRLEAWAYGQEPETDLEDNPALSGTASFTGVLLGFTPVGAAVSGSADVDVDLGSLQGSVAFMGLEAWPSGQPPGAEGAGQVWLDGDLHYRIAVDGSVFSRTGGDEGSLEGMFFGGEHEGLGGILERSDLVAAFGAER